MTGEEEWHDWRAQGIGASEVAAVVGLSPWESPWSLWARKTGLLSPSEPSDVMLFGRYAERMIAPWFTDVTGLHVLGEQTWCQHPDHPWARATVDGFVAEAEDAAPDEFAGLLEIKTEGPGRDWEHIPAHYQAQAQWQMFVTGLPRVWFAVLHGRRFRVYELARDDDDIAFLFDRVSSFWHDHVLTGNPPAVDGTTATTDALAAVYGRPQEAEVEVDPALVSALAQAKELLRAAEMDVDEMSNELRAAMGEATVATVGGVKVATWKPQTRTTVDTKALAADHPALAEKYRTTTEFRVLRTVKEKP